MVIAILIIACLTVIAVCVGLFLSYKANIKSLSIIANFQETTLQNINAFKKDIFEKIISLNNDTNSKLETSKIEILNILQRSIEKAHSEFTTIANENTKSMDNKISSTKTELLASIEPKLNSIKEDAQAIYNKSQKDLENMKSNVEEQLKKHENKQAEILIDITNKFTKILDEIKSPLTLD